MITNEDAQQFGEAIGAMTKSAIEERQTLMDGIVADLNTLNIRKLELAAELIAVLVRRP